MVSDVTLRRQMAAAVRAVMSDALSREMQWGVDDCTLWAIEPLRRVLGYDPASFARGRYRTRRGALRLLGCGGLPAMLRTGARRHGWRSISGREARAGDIGLIRNGGAVSLAVCLQAGWFVARAETGFVGVPAAQVSTAYRVA